MALLIDARYARINHIVEQTEKASFLLRFYESEESYRESVSEDAKSKNYIVDEVNYEAVEIDPSKPLREQCYKYVQSFQGGEYC